MEDDFSQQIPWIGQTGEIITQLRSNKLAPSPFFSTGYSRVDRREELLLYLYNDSRMFYLARDLSSHHIVWFNNEYK